MASWISADAAPWLVTSRSEGQRVVAGITFGAGWLHQPTEQLGVASLLAAWLTTSLNRPVEAPGFAFADPVQVAFKIDQVHSSLFVTAPGTDAVSAVLRRVDEVLDDTPTAEEFGSLRDRATTHANSLVPWRMHLAARWPGHRPHLAALGPLAVETLDSAAVRTFAAQRFGRAKRVYWANDRRVAELAGSSAGGGNEAMAVAPPAGRAEPGCVRRRSVNELATIAVRSGPADEAGLVLLGKVLHRRMIDFEPLASSVDLFGYDLDGDVTLACATADLLPGKNDAAVSAVIQTVEDLSAGGVPADELGRLRAVMAEHAESMDPAAPHTMIDLARRHLRLGDFPTPETLAAGWEEVGDEDVRGALAEFRPHLLVAVDSTEQADSPLPMAEGTATHVATGRRFRNRTTDARRLRCADEGVWLQERVRPRIGIGRWVTTSGVEFGDVVLRLEAGDQQTTLVDKQFQGVDLAWGLYPRAATLREIVDRGTTGIPVVREPENTEWSGWLRKRLRQQRRRIAIVVALVVAMIIAAGLVPLLETWDDPVATSMGLRETATLPNGTTLRVVDEPELIQHYDARNAYLYAIPIEMCAGRDENKNGYGEARNYFDAVKFELYTGWQAPPGAVRIAERPPPPQAYLAQGQCLTAWLLYRLSEPRLSQAPTLEYRNFSSDTVWWYLLPEPRSSPLSKPCPPPNPATPVWNGCPPR